MSLRSVSSSYVCSRGAWPQQGVPQRQMPIRLQPTVVVTPEHRCTKQTIEKNVSIQCQSGTNMICDSRETLRGRCCFSAKGQLPAKTIPPNGENIQRGENTQRENNCIRLALSFGCKSHIQHFRAKAHVTYFTSHLKKEVVVQPENHP
eukprot:2654201-Amphidinium_carterae.1